MTFGRYVKEVFVKQKDTNVRLTNRGQNNEIKVFMSSEYKYSMIYFW